VTVMQYVPVVQAFVFREFRVVPFICKDIYIQYLVDFCAEPLILEDI